MVVRLWALSPLDKFLATSMLGGGNLFTSSQLNFSQCQFGGGGSQFSPCLTIPTNTTEGQRNNYGGDTLNATYDFRQFSRKKGTFLVLIYDVTSHASSFPNG